MATLNQLNINGFTAMVTYDSDIKMFRGEFLDLNGDADFYADNIKDLKKEGEISLKVFLDMCTEECVEPK